MGEREKGKMKYSMRGSKKKRIGGQSEASRGKREGRSKKGEVKRDEDMLGTGLWMAES
jgi:hypothetical protein